ncbi:hypothetical protein EVAR_38340_1 [Eumeta japonica]|uniref:Uncharacterized protein n=1 Tax=Eumeta variegata TaxID=151549 RepID=A0A4C1X7P8_EUMVA|nr:hypothetical protein EVAR_38340_1 [Eumeta japonica]
MQSDRQEAKLAVYTPASRSRNGYGKLKGEKKRRNEEITLQQRRKQRRRREAAIKVRSIREVSVSTDAVSAIRNIERQIRPPPGDELEVF